MMTNAWKLGERPKYEGQKAWKGEEDNNNSNTSSSQKYSNRYRKAVPASQNAPWGISEGKTNYSTSSNPKNVSIKIGKGGSASYVEV